MLFVERDHDEFFISTLVKLGLIEDELDGIELIIKLEDKYYYKEQYGE